jgi:hypothetical protein
LEQIREFQAQGYDLLNPAFKIKHRNLYLAACAHRYFGSWRRAIQAAGLDHETMRETRVWTKERIRRTIEEMAMAGEPLGWAYVEEHCPGIYRAARRKENFGSWHNALIQSGVRPPVIQRGRRPNLTPEQRAQSERLTIVAQAERQRPDSQAATRRPGSVQ